MSSFRALSEAIQGPWLASPGKPTQRHSVTRTPAPGTQARRITEMAEANRFLRERLPPLHGPLRRHPLRAAGAQQRLSAATTTKGRRSRRAAPVPSPRRPRDPLRRSPPPWRQPLRARPLPHRPNHINRSGQLIWYINRSTQNVLDSPRVRKGCGGSPESLPLLSAVRGRDDLVVRQVLGLVCATPCQPDIDPGAACELQLALPADRAAHRGGVHGARPSLVRVLRQRSDCAPGERQAEGPRQHRSTRGGDAEGATARQ